MKKNTLIIISLLFTYINLCSFPIRNFDYHLPLNHPSPVVSAMGGMNFTSTDDYFLGYDNPALLPYNEQAKISSSFLIASKSNETVNLFNPGNLIKKNTLKSLAYSGDKGGVYFFSLVDDNTDTIDSTGTNSLYRRYELNAFQISAGDKKESYSYGFSIKYLNGRLIYLESSLSDTLITKQDFIDAKVNGFSTDLAFFFNKKFIKCGVTFYDLYSKMYWEHNKNVSLQPRIGIGFENGSENLKITYGALGKLKWHTDPIYQAGLAQIFSLGGTPDQPSTLPIRLGVMGKKFQKSDEIFFSFGSGYYIKTFKVDFSIVNHGWKSKNSQYLFSVTMGV